MRSLFVLLLVFAACASRPAALPSWNDGPAKHAVLDYVERITTPGADYVAPRDRIATFDNDGTLWSEKPMYFQLAFIIERVKAMANDDPKLREQDPYKAVLDGELSELHGPDVAKLLTTTQSGMTEAEFGEMARGWFASARHPRFQRPYTELIYQPMLELLDLLRANDFDVWICTGGTQGFVRTISEPLYGIPPERVIGTQLQAKFERRDDRWVLVRQPELAHFNDKPFKPVGIQRQIGKRAIVAVGNSDGDIQMLQWAREPALRVLVHHDDASREYSYKRGTEKALELAKKGSWTVVSIRKDFKTVYPEAKR